MDKKPVRKIGKYELIGKVAEGGMGALYKARHPTLDRVVLLKQLSLRGGGQFVERFRREARLMMDFKNEHIVQVHDHFKEGPHYFIVEEFVDGLSLDALIRRERYLSNDAAALLFYEMCKALKYAHDKGVVHRDIKPGNILISRQGQVKLADFGIATSLEEGDDSLTREGMVLGTPAYIPPEQIDNARTVDRRADIYSLGVVLYEMLTGKTPYPGSFTAETLHLIQKGRYVAPLRLNPRASPLLCRIVRTCMRVRRSRRYQDLGAIIRILERTIRRRDQPTIEKAIQRILQGSDIEDLFGRKRSWLRWLAAALVIAALLIGGGYLLYRQGFWFEYFLPNRYGALVVAAEVDGAYKGPDEIFFSPVLYRESGDQITRITGLDFGLHEDKGRPASQSYILESRRLYLQAGRYRLKASLEGQLLWSSFTLNPRSLQKKQISTLDGQRITLRQGGGIPVPLQVRYTVTDATTGENLTDSSVLSVFLGGHWVPWSDATAAGLATGRTYRFRISRPGYDAEEYSLIIKPYQDFLTLDAALVPLPGTLSLQSDIEGVTLLLNGSDRYTAGGSDARYQKLEPLGLGLRRIILAPGEYTLTVRRDPAPDTSVSFRMSPGGLVSVSITFDRNTSALSAALGG